ncbi:MAG: hypothetical protein KDD77_10260 [Caldilineaceae bacterium]|nr:hypothetical protein [Caldilineaceae bacterium]
MTSDRTLRPVNAEKLDHRYDDGEAKGVPAHQLARLGSFAKISCKGMAPATPLAHRSDTQ